MNVEFVSWPLSNLLDVEGHAKSGSAKNAQSGLSLPVSTVPIDAPPLSSYKLFLKKIKISNALSYPRHAPYLF